MGISSEDRYEEKWMLVFEIDGPAVGYLDVVGLTDRNDGWRLFGCNNVLDSEHERE